MNASDQVRQFVHEQYIVPARRKGAKTVTVLAGEVHKALKWDPRRIPQVCSALSTRKFLHSAHLELVSRQGPPSGQSPTVKFTYKILDPDQAPASSSATGSAQVRDGAGLESLYGILEEEFKALGGGEAYLRAERDSWGPDPWDRLEMEKHAAAEGTK